MSQIIRILTYPALLLTQRILKSYLTVSLYLVLTCIFLCIANNYLNKSVSSHLINNNADQQILSTKKNVTNLSTTEKYTKEIRIKKGDTINSILKKEKIHKSDINQIVQLAKKNKQTQSLLQIGQIIKLVFTIENDLEGTDKEKLLLDSVIFKIDRTRSITFIREKNSFKLSETFKPLKKLITKYETFIDTNLSDSLKKIGLDRNIVANITKTYSYQIDFQRQIRPGDKITIIAEKFVNSDGELSHHGKIISSTLETQNKTYEIYRYSPNGKDSEAQFFSSDGHTIKTSLLSTPLKIAKVSSRFGYRKHPILGYSVMHKGVDFRASKGTPIYAAGSGVIDFIGYKSGYGRFIVINHNNGLSTAYAHASKFSPSLKRGSKIKQGDVIAYVGASGRATGPHLHYEVRINGKQVDPMKFKSSPSIKLSGKALAQFNKYKETVKNLATNDGLTEIAEGNIASKFR